MLRLTLVAAFAGIGLISVAADAVPFGSGPITVALGSGVTAEREPHACGSWVVYGTGCFVWRLNGASAPDDILERANMFAAAPGGRIAAAMPDGVAFTDDRGASWRRGRWDGSATPLSLAFDAHSDFGVAVGTNGSVWTTENRGETWHERRDTAGVRLVDVGVVGRTVVFVSDHGAVWASTDGGTSVRTLAEGSPQTGSSVPTVTTRGDALWVAAGGGVWWRADASASIERVDHGP